MLRHSHAASPNHLDWLSRLALTKDATASAAWQRGGSVGCVRRGVREGGDHSTNSIDQRSSRVLRGTGTDTSQRRHVHRCWSSSTAKDMARESRFGKPAGERRRFDRLDHPILFFLSPPARARIRNLHRLAMDGPALSKTRKSMHCCSCDRDLPGIIKHGMPSIPGAAVGVVFHLLRYRSRPSRQI